MNRHKQQRPMGLPFHPPVFLLIVLMVSIALALSGNWAVAEVAPDSRRGAASLVSNGSGTQVSLDPPAAQLAPGASQAVDVLISEVVDLYGFEIHIGFNPAIIQITDLAYGSFLSPDIVAQLNYDNVVGTVDVSISQKGDLSSDPRSGGGLLFTLTFDAVAPGDAEFAFTSVLLSNQNGISLANSTSQPDIMVLQASATPSSTPTTTPTATPSPSATINPSATPYYYLEPQALSLDLGETKQMQIRTSYVQGLGGVEVHLRWDPAKVQVIDALPENPGVQLAPGNLFDGYPVLQPSNGNDVDNAAGELDYSLIYLDVPPGVDGEWTVATISFTGMLTGTTIVEFHGPDTLMTDAEGLTIPSGWMNGQITVATTDDPTPTPSITATPTAVVICSDRILNGGLEQGEQNWTTQGGTTFDGIPRTGAQSAYLGGYDQATDGISQLVTIPTDALSAQLDYWWYLFTVEPDHPHDYFYVEIYDMGGNLQETVATMNDGSLAGQWQQGTHDLIGYAGQTIRVSFRVETDKRFGPDTDSYYTSFYVDDVSVQVCAYEEPTAEGRVVLPLVMDNFVK